MTQALLQMLGSGGASPPTYVDDVFSAYTFTGTSASQNIVNGIDLAGKGGMVWEKYRNVASAHRLFDTARGVTKEIYSHNTDSQATDALTLTSFNADGYTTGGRYTAAQNMASWTFRKAPKFFSQSTATVTGGVDATVSFSDLATLGMVVVKRTDAAGSWYVWHRSATAGKLLYLEQTAAEATLGHITVSGTTVTLEGGVIANGTYIVYAWAHDASADGIVQCGSMAVASNIATVTLGWEPQFLLVKQASGAGGDWRITDVSRAFSRTKNLYLVPNTSAADSNSGLADGMTPTATGFYTNGFFADGDYIYLAIRRPNKPPTTGTQVYQAIARTGTSAAATVTGVGFAPDLTIISNRLKAGSIHDSVYDRLRGATKYALTQLTNAELTLTDELTAFNMDGVSFGASGNEYTNGIRTYINWFFKRAPGVFDQVCYPGTGVAKTEAHNLTVAPEFWIVKGRSGATAWAAGCTALANTEYLVPNTTAAKATGSTYWNSTFPTSSVFSVGTAGAVNTSTATYVAYLFATKAGISKVGSYTGNATTNTINCGFTTGARFVLIKRTDSAGDWYVWDTVRGIIAGNDPYLLLNSTAAEVTSTDYIDPSTAGFELSSTAPAAINANGGTFIYLAFA